MKKSALVFLTDQRGFELTEHAAAAALITQGSIRHIIVFCVDFLPLEQTRLQEQAKNRDFAFEYRPIDGVCSARVGYVASDAHSHVTSAALLKMAALNALSTEFDRALYVDSDVLLMQDFELAKIDFGGAAIAAVYDIARSGGLSSDPDFFERCAAYGRSPHYFNSGVIAVDFARWNAHYVLQYNLALLEHAKRCDYKADCSSTDQCAWNRVFERAWKRLPLTLNLQACAMFSYHWTDAVVRHYVGPVKFIPFRAWRNDALDTVLLNQARRVIGLPPLGYWPARLVKSINAVRNYQFAKAADAAIFRIQQMYIEPM